MNKISILNQPVNTPTNLRILSGLASFLRDLTQGNRSFYIKESGNSDFPAIAGPQENRDCPKSAYLLQANGAAPFFRGILSQLIYSQYVTTFYLHNINIEERWGGDCPIEASIYIKSLLPKPKTWSLRGAVGDEAIPKVASKAKQSKEIASPLASLVARNDKLVIKN